MNPPTAKDLILDSAPTEHRAEYARCLDQLSRNPNDPFFVVFAIITQSYHNNTAILQTRLAAAEEREKLRTEKLEKERVENLKAMRNAANSIKGEGIGWRIITSKLLGTVIFVVVASIAANYIIQSKVLTIDPEYHAKIQSLEQRIDGQAQLQNVKIDSIARGTKELTAATKANALANYQTLLGKALAIHVFEIGESYIMLQTSDPKSGKRTPAYYRHHLNPAEYEQLRLDVVRIKQISTE